MQINNPVSIKYQKTGTFLEQVKAMARIQGKDVLPDIKLPKPRKPRSRETQPRRQEEALFRKEVIQYFKSHGIQYRRIENSICGTHGRDIPDFWVFYNPKRYAGFVELKRQDGKLSTGQVEFEINCLHCGINHITARTLEDLKPITGGNSNG